MDNEKIMNLAQAYLAKKAAEDAFNNAGTTLRNAEYDSAMLRGKPVTVLLDGKAVTITRTSMSRSGDFTYVVSQVV